MVDQAVIAEARRALGRQLAAYREAAGLNQHELAPLVHYGRSTIANAETGHTGCSRVFWERCDEALNADGALIRGYHDLQAAGRAQHAEVAEQAAVERAALLRGVTGQQPAGAPDRSVEVAAAGGDPGVSPGLGVDTIGLEVRYDGAAVVVPLSRRVLARAGVGRLVEAFALDRDADVLRDIVEQPDLARRLTINSPAHLQEILAHLNEQWHALVRTDNLLGPRFALAGVLNQIAAIEGLLPSVRDRARRDTVGLGARYAESAAWLWEDSGNLVQARYWTGRAMEWAYEAGDHAMLAWTLARRAQQAAAARDAGQAIGLVQAARRSEATVGAPMRAALRVQQAYGHALDGDEHTCHRLLDQAHRWAAHDTVGDAREGHGSYCTPGYIELQRAACWLLLDRPTNAVRLYETALPMLPVVYQRDRAAALTGLAAAYAANHQMEQAATVAHQALPVARAAGSHRILGEITTVSAGLIPHRPLPTVAALLDDLSAQDG